MGNKDRREVPEARQIDRAALPGVRSARAPERRGCRAWGVECDRSDEERTVPAWIERFGKNQGVAAASTR